MTLVMKLAKRRKLPLDRPCAQPLVIFMVEFGEAKAISVLKPPWGTSRQLEDCKTSLLFSLSLV